MCSVLRCPVCRYCQTPEPVEENKCFECGVQEVTEKLCLVSKLILIKSFYLTDLFLFLHRTCGFVWSVVTSAVAAMLAVMHISTLRKRSIPTLCSSPTTVCGTTQEVQTLCVCVGMYCTSVDGLQVCRCNNNCVHQGAPYISFDNQNSPFIPEAFWFVCTWWWFITEHHITSQYRLLVLHFNNPESIGI